MNQLNRRQDPEIESVYLMASPEYSFSPRAASRSSRRSAGGSTIWCPDAVAERLQEELER